MTTPKTYDVTHLQTIRVDLHELPGHYVLIVPDPATGPFYRDFYLLRDDTGNAVHMFGTPIQDDDLAAEMAAWNAPGYVDRLPEVEA